MTSDQAERALHRLDAMMSKAEQKLLRSQDRKMRRDGVDADDREALLAEQREGIEANHDRLVRKMLGHAFAFSEDPPRSTFTQ